MNIISITLAATALIITGCASGPVQIGRDTYLMTDTAASSWASGASIKAGLYQDAYKFCSSKGRELLPLRSRQTDADFTRFGNAELEFRCVDANDPELARSKGGLPYAPDIRIEVK